MAGDYGWKTINRAIKADVLSLTFFEIGLFGWMAIFDLLIFRQKLHMNTIAYWFMMQVCYLSQDLSRGILTLWSIDRYVLRALDWISDKLVAD